jgi:hypothetical protein
LGDDTVSQRKMVGKGDQRNLNLVGLDPDTRNDGSNRSGFGFFIIDTNAKVVQNITHGCDYPIDLRVLDRAAGDIDDFACTHLIKPSDKRASLNAKLQLSFVPIRPRVLHADNRANGGLRQIRSIARTIRERALPSLSAVPHRSYAEAGNRRKLRRRDSPASCGGGVLLD